MAFDLLHDFEASMLSTFKNTVKILAYRNLRDFEQAKS